VRTEIETLRAEHRVALAETTEAEARIPFLTSQLERQARLREKGMVREEAYDEARHNLEAARARIGALQERTRRVVTALGGDLKLPPEQHPRVLEAKAAVDAAALDLSRTRISAPAAGIVSNLKLQPGEHVATGTSLFSLIPAGEVWIEANFKETQLAGVRVGQPVRVVADAYPGVEFPAKVRAISPATGAQFALLPPQNASGNWIKIVQRVPVRIALDPQELAAHPLRIGLSMHAEIDLHDQSGPVLAAPRREVAATMPGHPERDEQVEALIAKTIAANSTR
jgi:membrane fusion protein (multidrug efflux system)